MYFPTTTQNQLFYTIPTPLDVRLFFVGNVFKKFKNNIVHK